MKCKPNCAPGGTLSRTRLESCSGGILAIHWRILASRSGSTLAGYSVGFTGKGYLVGYLAGSTGELLWDTQRDTRRDPLASCSGGILGGIHWRAALAGYWVGALCRSIANADSNINLPTPSCRVGNKGWASKGCFFGG